MQKDRRTFLAWATGATAAVLCGSQAGLGQTEEPGHYAAPNSSGLEEEILDLFSDLPDRKALKIWAPATDDGPEVLVQLNANQRMFVASTLKSVILCERLRQLDSPTVEKQITGHELALDQNIWSPGSPIFNPPDLSGLVSERTAMEAMIIHSDNTATDMILKQAGADAVRKFIASIGLNKTMIPDSTRIFAAYLFGAPNYKTITWEELTSIPPGRLAHPFLNDVETLASSPDDLVSFFSRALQGDFFSHQETLFQFRRILSLGDINHLVPFPLGLSVFGKAGYADIPEEHARSIAGAVYFPNRWVYFSMVLNWDAEQAEDPATVKAFYGAIRKSVVLLQQCLTS
jgi:beta-lactamase class A